jgi:hypothetical protein
VDAGALIVRRRPPRAGVAIAWIAPLVLLALALALVGCSDDGGATAAPESTTTSTALPDGAATSTTMTTPVGDPVLRTQLVVGDCFNSYDDIDVTTRVPCGVEHDGEVFHYENHAAPFGEPYPAERELEKYALRACYAQFETFTGGLYEVSRLEIGAVTPTREQWEDSAARYRGIICYVFDPSGAELVGSMRGRAE